jgi:hypothetical protein
VHLSEGEAELLPFSDDMVVPGEVSVQVESEIFDVICTGKNWQQVCPK